MNNQKSFTPIVTILIIVVLLAGGILTWQYLEVSKEEVKTPEEISEEMSKEIKIPEVKVSEKNIEEQLLQCGEVGIEKPVSGAFEKINCYSNIFKKEAYTEDWCKKIEEKDLCYMGVAIGKQDETFCLEIEDDSSQELCYAEIYMLEPGITKEEIIANCSDDFLEPIATLICYNSAFEITGYNETLCKEAEYDYEKEICYMGAAIGKKNEKLCEKLSEEGKIACYVELAVIKKDETLCEGIEQKDDCYGVMAVEKRDETLCEKLSEVFRDNCYRVMAELKKDESICEKAGEAKNSCYINIAEETENEHLCENVNENKDFCYLRVASKKQNELICEKIEEMGRRYDCYNSVAAAKKDETLCEKLPGEKPYAKEICYWVVAKEKKDETLCEKTGRIKDACYNSL